MKRLLGLVLIGAGITLFAFGGLFGFSSLDSIGLFIILATLIIAGPITLLGFLLAKRSIGETIKWAAVLAVAVPILFYILVDRLFY